MALFGFLARYWQFFAVAGLVATAAGTVFLLREKIDDLEAAVEIAEAREETALNSLMTERAAVDDLQDRLLAAQQRLETDRAARDAANREADEAQSRSAEREAALSETITVERRDDPTLDQCLSLELPDSILQQLPE